MADHSLRRRAETVFAAAERGDLGDLAPTLDALAGGEGVLEQAWRWALGAWQLAFGIDAAVVPSPAAVGDLSSEDPEVRRVGSLAATLMQRASVARFDAAALHAWVDVHARVVPAGFAEGQLAVRAGRLWQRLLAGPQPGQSSESDEAEALFDQASALRSAPLVIESMVLRAFSAMAYAQVDEALDMARRASRMSQAEGLPQYEYLAHIVLARLRRHSGRAHLALHILTALGRVASDLWFPWIAWETLLAGGDSSPLLERLAHLRRDSPAGAAVRALAALLHAARTGDREGFASAAANVNRALGVSRLLRHDVETLAALLDVRRETRDPDVLAWRRGDVHATPAGVHGISSAAGLPSSTEAIGDSILAYVVADPAWPGGRGGRVLGPGLALDPVLAASPTVQSDANLGTRPDIGLSVLALAGTDGASRDEFFRATYGFPFVPGRHQAVLDVLTHRMRARLADVGTIRRTSPPPVFALVLTKPIAVPDHRCQLPIAEQVLRVIAGRGTASAQEAAETLRMPLRTVQTALRQLVSDGSCSPQRSGPRVAYRIQDTTFTEVTR